MSNKTMKLIFETLDFEALVDYVHQRSEFDGSGCWFWTKAIDKGTGAPAISQGGSVRRVIADMVQEINGESRATRVTPSCGEILCVNPDHLLMSFKVGERVEYFEKQNDWDGFIDYLDMNSEEVFCSKFPEDPCWNWIGPSSNWGGYLQVTRYKGGTNSLHRIIGTAFRNAPDASVVHHKCANRKCINPDHLQVVNQKDNVAEMLGRNWYEGRIESAEEILSSLLPHIKNKHFRNRVESFLSEAA